MSDEVRRIEGEILRETERAYRIATDDKAVWIPKSEIQRMKRVGDEVTIDIPLWLFRREVE